MNQDVEILGNGAVTVKIPGGVVIVSHLNNIGTQVMVYDDVNSNPMGYINIKENR